MLGGHFIWERIQDIVDDNMLFGRQFLYNNNLEDNGENTIVLKRTSVDVMLEAVRSIISSLQKLLKTLEVLDKTHRIGLSYPSIHIFLLIFKWCLDILISFYKFSKYRSVVKIYGLCEFRDVPAHNKDTICITETHNANRMNISSVRETICNT